MSNRNTTKATGAKVATSKKSENGKGKNAVKGPVHYELLPQDKVSDNDSQVEVAEKGFSAMQEGTKTSTKKAMATIKSKPKEVIPKKEVKGKGAVVNSKKIKIAASTYHYYRNWLAEFMQSHGVSSARFQKAPESYSGHIMVLETDKAKGIKALEQWSKQNPDTKELFWDVKK